MFSRSLSPPICDSAHARCDARVPRLKPQHANFTRQSKEPARGLEEKGIDFLNNGN